MQINIKVTNLTSVKKQLRLYKEDIHKKVNKFVKRLAQEGVQIARIRVRTDTHALQKSIKYKKGEVFKEGSTWIVYTDNPYAKFVEFGTGIIGEGSPHPLNGQFDWEYDIHNHGDDGWYYIKNNNLYHTLGQTSNQFMYGTSQELYNKISEIAKEVFG